MDINKYLDMGKLFTFILKVLTYYFNFVVNDVIPPIRSVCSNIVKLCKNNNQNKADEEDLMYVNNPKENNGGTNNNEHYEYPIMCWDIENM